MLLFQEFCNASIDLLAEDPLTLKEVHDHMIRSPPPISFWPQGESFYFLLLAYEIMKLLLSLHINFTHIYIMIVFIHGKDKTLFVNDTQIKLSLCSYIQGDWKLMVQPRVSILHREPNNFFFSFLIFTFYFYFVLPFPFYLTANKVYNKLLDPSVCFNAFLKTVNS